MNILKKLYALLIILIIVYIGFNISVDGLNIFNSQTDEAVSNDDSGSVALGDYKFDIGDFTSKKINDTAVSLTDSGKNIVINVSAIDNSQDIANIAANTYSSGGFTSNQTIDQNGVTVYLLYNEGSDSYSSDIFFSKNDQNYMITGSSVGYDNSDYFIDSCKDIIDSLNIESDNGSGEFRRW